MKGLNISTLKKAKYFYKLLNSISFQNTLDKIDNLKKLQKQLSVISVKKWQAKFLAYVGCILVKNHSISEKISDTNTQICNLML